MFPDVKLANQTGFWILVVFFQVIVISFSAKGDELELQDATLVSSINSTVQQSTTNLFLDEVYKRTRIKLAHTTSSKGRGPEIIFGCPESMPNGKIKLPANIRIPNKAEGFAIWVDDSLNNRTRIYVMGRDERGLLFGAGRLLRLLHMRDGSLSIDSTARVITAPQYALRGHQIGYRNTANSYDAWSIKQYEQYIKDLVVFGTNSIELIPSLDPEERNSVHMDLNIWDMTISLSSLLDDYGLDVWFWLSLRGDVSDPAVAENELVQRRKLFESCERIDDIFVPGGDPGETHPDILMPWLKRMAAVLHDTHPNAGLWVSNQGFTPEENDAFFGYIREHKPDWLAGVVFGPWVKISIEEMRAATPSRYPIRRYPDITHTVRCQYPVPEWDRAFAHTLGREPFNPRPKAMKQIQAVFAQYAAGSVTYSDGINDDINKALWSSFEWDSNFTIDDLLNDYGRYFIGEDFGKLAAEGINAFEVNWKGPLSSQTGIEENFDRWKKIEAQSDSLTLSSNWRLQLCLLRAYYDTYVQRRLLWETELEEKAYIALSEAKSNDVVPSIEKAKVILAIADDQPLAIKELRNRLESLGNTLYKSIGMQLDVTHYKASGSERGAVLESLYEPLNNRKWLEKEFETIINLSSSEEQLHRINTIINWESPSSGSFYDDLGNSSKQPHLMSQMEWGQDPGRVFSTQEEYSKSSDARLSWVDQGQTLFGTPLKMEYTGLDPSATYRLRVTYAGRFRATMKLLANDNQVVHEALEQPITIGPIEFSLPEGATKRGSLKLEWQLVDGRGCQVAEVWLVKN